MNDDELIECRANLVAIEVTLSLFLAEIARGNRKALGKMHEALQGVLIDAVTNAAGGQPGRPEFGRRFEALAGQALDRIFSTAGAIK